MSNQEWVKDVNQWNDIVRKFPNGYYRIRTGIFSGKCQLFLPDLTYVEDNSISVLKDLAERHLKSGKIPSDFKVLPPLWRMEYP